MQIKTTRDITSNLSGCLSSINQQTTSAGEDVEKGGPSYTVGRNTDWCSQLGKLGLSHQEAHVSMLLENSMEFSQNIKNGTNCLLTQ